MRGFIRGLVMGCVMLGWVVAVEAEIKTQEVSYKVGEETYVGYVAYEGEAMGKRPVVVVVHEWWGLNDYAKMRAQKLAEHGYVGYAVDMYGQGRTTMDPKQAGEWAGQVKKDPQAVKRIEAALEAIAGMPEADVKKVAAIGYCFGGTVVLEWARSGAEAALVASFHGNLAPVNGPAKEKIKAQVLVLHGADDAFESAANIAAFQEEMRKVKADWTMVYYGGAVHSFTNPKADSFGIAGVSYQKQADERSWELLVDSLEKVFEVEEEDELEKK